MVEKSREEIDQDDSFIPKTERNSIMQSLFRQVGKIAAGTQKLSEHAVHGMAKKLALLDFHKKYLARNLLHTDALYFKKLVEMKPDSADAHYNLGIALVGKMRFNEALLHLEKAAFLDFHHIRAYLGIARACGKLRRYDRAIEALKKALTYDDKNAEIYCELGIAYDNKGMRDDAISMLNKAIDIKPDYKKAHETLGSMEKLRTVEKGKD